MAVGRARDDSNVLAGIQGGYAPLNASLQMGGAYGGGPFLLAKLTASSSDSLDFTTRNISPATGNLFQSDFDVYELVFVNLVPVTNATALWLRVTTDGGSTFKSGATDYQWATFFEVNNASSNNGSGGDTKVGLVGGSGSISNTASRAGANGTFRIYGPLDTTVNTAVHGHGVHQSTTNSNLATNLLTAGQYLATTAVNGFQLLMSSGAIASGSAYVYGIAKA